MIYRSFFFIGVLLLSLFITPLIAVPVALAYARLWFAPELIAIGFLIDTYFNASGAWPWYTIGAFLLVMAIEIAKKYLFLRTPTHPLKHHR